MVSCLRAGHAVLLAQHARILLWDIMMPPSKNTAAQVIIVFLLGWIFVFNVFMKQQGLGEAFFQLINTVSEDLVMGAGSGLIAVLMFGVCTVFGNIFVLFLSRRDFFGCLDAILSSGKGIGECLSQLIQLEDADRNEQIVPSSTVGIIASLSFAYACGLLSVVVFAQPFWTYVSSAHDVQGVVLFALVPMLTVRFLTLLGYRYGARLANAIVFFVLFLLLIDIAEVLNLLSLGLSCYPSDIYLQKLYLHDMTLYAFLPVLLESLAWLILLFSAEEEST